jgi:hypothetical protein
MRIAFLAAVAAVALAGGAQAANLVQNGSFTQNTLPSTVAANGYSGAEFDNLWNYGGSVTGWSTVASPSYSQAYNLYFFGGNNTTTADADTRYTASEPQHPNSNFTGNSPDGGAFVVLDGDPGFSAPLEQIVSGLTVGNSYTLSFYWAAGELSNRTGYQTEQMTGSFGSDSFATSVFNNSQPSGVPGDFSGWQKASFKFTAHSTSQLLSFLSVGTPAANLPPVGFLDGVSVTGAPEPGVWAIMLVGFGGMGALLRRRRAAANAA